MAKTTYHRRKDAGLCPICGGSRPDRAFVQCASCRQKDKGRDIPALRDGGEPYEPTAKEIAEAAAEIQARWSSAVEKKRRGANDAPVVFPVYRVV